MSARPMRRPRATSIGARPARTSSTPRPCSRFAPASMHCDADLSRAIKGFAALARSHRNTADGGADLAPARAADAVRAEGRRIRRKPRPRPLPPAAALPRGPCAAIRRCRRHARGARRQGARRCRAVGAGAEPAAAGSALAHPSRPDRGSRIMLRDSRRKLRQDRARRLADDADRCRRSVRARRRRPRRLLDHAAQAQPGRRRERAGLPRPWRRSSPRRSSPRRCRTTSAAPAPGTRNGRRCRN